MTKVEITKGQVADIANICNKVALNSENNLRSTGVSVRGHGVVVWFRAQRLITAKGYERVFHTRFMISYKDRGIQVRHFSSDVVHDDNYDYVAKKDDVEVFRRLEEVSEFINMKVADMVENHAKALQEGCKLATPVEDSMYKVTKVSCFYLENLLREGNIRGYRISLDGSRVAFMYNKENNYRSCEYSYGSGQVEEEVYKWEGTGINTSTFKYDLVQHPVFLEDMFLRGKTKSLLKESN